MSVLPLQQWLRKRAATVTLHVRCLHFPLVTSLHVTRTITSVEVQEGNLLSRLTKHHAETSYGGVKV